MAISDRLFGMVAGDRRGKGADDGYLPPRNEPAQLVMRWWLYIVLAVLLAILVLSSYFTVNQYERGIVTTWGKFSYVATPGLSFKVPFVQSVHKWRIDILTVQPKAAVNTYTEDNQEIDIIFTVFYRLPPDKLPAIYENAQDYHERLLNIANDRLKTEMGKVKLEHFAQHRGEIRDAIRKTVLTDAQMLGVAVTDFQFTDVNYTKAFRAAVEQASVQKAQVETKEWQRQQADKDAQTARIRAEGEANAVREKAKGDSDATLLNAKAEAEAIRIKGEAQAKAMDAQARALAQNAHLVEMKKAEAWDGKLPVNIYGAAPVPWLNVK